jgi:hypothetical protein
LSRFETVKMPALLMTTSMLDASLVAPIIETGTERSSWMGIMSQYYGWQHTRSLHCHFQLWT